MAPPAEARSEIYAHLIIGSLVDLDDRRGRAVHSLKVPLGRLAGRRPDNVEGLENLTVSSISVS